MLYKARQAGGEGLTGRKEPSDRRLSPRSSRDSQAVPSSVGALARASGVAAQNASSFKPFDSKEGLRNLQKKAHVGPPPLFFGDVEGCDARLDFDLAIWVQWVLSFKSTVQVLNRF